MTFAELLKIKKKHLKPASIDTYLRNIKRLRKVYHDLPIPDSSVSWLSEKKLFTWFDKEPLNVRRHLATAANVAFSVLEKKNKEWATRQNIAMKEFDSDRRARKLTDKQKKMLPDKGFDALKTAIGIMKRSLRHILKKIDSQKDLLRFQDLMIISLYHDIPLRLDYASLRLGKREGNCMYKNTKKPRGWHIQLKEYKTAKTMGTRTFKLNVANQRLLNLFIPAVQKLTEHGFLLTNKTGGKMSRQVLSKTLMRITQKHIGKRFSSQLLRILFAMKSRDIIESAKEVSDKLLHSTEQSLSYAKKDPQ